ncbi:MAG: hypothetical protein AAF646_00030 [Pseudomonadota bacterium]
MTMERIDAAGRHVGDTRVEASILVAVLGVAFGAYVTALGGAMFRLDDAYIVLNNAQALFAPDTAFPNTPALYGSTSLVHTLLTAGVGWVLPPELGLMLLAWVAVALFGLGVLELGRMAGLAAPLRVAIAICALTTGDFVRVHLNGLETGLAMAVVTWLIVLHRRRSPALPWLAALAPFIRPELLLLSGLIIGDVLWRARVWRDFSAALQIGAAFVVALVALLVLQFWISGGLFPSTGDAKRYFFVTSDLGLERELRIGGMQLVAFLTQAQILPQSLFLLFLFRGPNRSYLLFAMALVAYFVYVQPLIMHQTYYRYLYLLVPLFCLGMVDAIASERKLVRDLSFAVVLGALVLNAFNAVQRVPANVASVQDKYYALTDVADWIERNTAPDEVVMIHDIGYLAYAVDRPFYDVVGLKSPASVVLNRDLTFRSGKEGRGAALAEMAHRSGARLFVVSKAWDRNFGLIRSLEAQGWSAKAHPGREMIEYMAFVLTPPAS